MDEEVFTAVEGREGGRERLSGWEGAVAGDNAHHGGLNGSIAKGTVLGIGRPGVSGIELVYGSDLTAVYEGGMSALVVGDWESWSGGGR